MPLAEEDLTLKTEELGVRSQESESRREEQKQLLRSTGYCLLSPGF